METLLYRDENVTAAVPWAEELVRDSQGLLEFLQDPEGLTVAKVSAKAW